MSPDAWIAQSEAKGLNDTERRARNAGFERAEQARFADFFDTVLPQPLNDEQRAAIVVDEDATLVVASAGSGKTTLLLGKIAYLVMRGLAQPKEIALLAFNNSVRAEIRERLAASHPDVAVHTFHSLGLELVRAASGGACRLSPMATDGGALQAFIADALRAMAQSDPDLLAEWLAAHVHPHREATDFASAREWTAWSRRHPPIGLRGERLRSQPLREVADRLALAGIAYRAGVALPLLPGAAPYMPDLLLPDARLVIDVGEPAAALGRGSAAARSGRGAGRSSPAKKGFGGMARRLANTIRAWLACRRHRLKRVYLRDAVKQHRDGRLGERLAALLTPHGLDLAPRALPAVLAGKLAADRLDETVNRLATCLTLQRGGPSLEQVAGKASDPLPGPIDLRDRRRAGVFAALLGRVTERYADHLAARGEIDFGDMIAGAAQALDSGAVSVPFRYLLVDEFQDISAGRAALVKALRRSRPGMRLVAVGDDWQSIYRFAGSDVSIMTGFEGHFGHTETRFLRRTFRFDRRLEAVASAFVLRNPMQIRKQVEAREPDGEAPAVVLWLPPEEAADDPMPGIARHLLGTSSGVPTAGADLPDVLILGRYRSLEVQARLDWLAAHHPQARWRYSTIHRAKGATADYAVVLGVRGGRQPFPAERPEDPLLAGFLGAVEPFPYAEERRLFYVALTRARYRVYVVGDRRQPSAFFEELLARGDCIVAGWDNLAT